MPKDNTSHKERDKSNVPPAGDGPINIGVGEDQQENQDSKQDQHDKQDKQDKPAEDAGPKTGTALQQMDFGEDAGAGMQNLDKSEFVIPGLRILQSNSPQCRPPAVGGLIGAKAGMIINTGTNQIYDGEAGVPFVPVHRDHNFVEFYPRPPNGPGGFVGIHPADDPLIAGLRKKHGQFGKLPHDKEGSPTEISESFYLFGLLPVENETAMCVISFQSTQIKKYKNFVTRVMPIQYIGPSGRPVQPPLWAHLWHLKTRYETKGENAWYGWSIELSKQTPFESLLKRDSHLYLQGKEFYRLIQEGRTKVDYETEAGASEPDDDEIPM